MKQKIYIYTIVTVAIFCIDVKLLIAQMPLKYGQVLVTGGHNNNFVISNHSPTFGTLRLKDTECRPAPSNANWAVPEYIHTDWQHGTTDGTGLKTDKLGEVFGIAIDTQGFVYVSDYSGYSVAYRRTVDSLLVCPPHQADNAETVGVRPKGKGGSGAIYKINNMTGAVTVLATLPQQLVLPLFSSTNTICQTFTDSYGRSWPIVWAEDVDTGRKLGPGLGNICFSPKHNKLYVTNFEDGKIYPITTTGAIGTTYDPMTPDDGLPGFAPLGERVWAVGYYDNRIYYSVWQQEFGTNTENTIRSVLIDAAGNFVSGTDQLEISVPHIAGYTGRNGGDGSSWVANPVTDIEFSDEGKMLISSKSMFSDFAERGHTAPVLEYGKVLGVWKNPIVYYTGVYLSNYSTKFNHATGGVDYGYGSCISGAVDDNTEGDIIWASGNVLRHSILDTLQPRPMIIYGLQSIPIGGNSNLSPQAVIINSNLIDFDGNTGNGANPKGHIGDVDVFREFTDCISDTVMLCNNGSDQIFLDADVGLTNIVWYDSTTNSVIGTGTTLTMNGLEPSLSDGYEAFYYTGTLPDGCPAEACCPIRVYTTVCTTCASSSTFSSQCNNNGTPANSADDWFILTITGSITNGSGNYVVKIGAYTSSPTASGSPITITGNGQAGNPLFQANGTSTYTVRIEDATDSTCFSTITVGPVLACSNCTDPNCFNVTKQIIR